jgi:hypothetical protein
VGDLLVSSNVAPWEEVRDRLNRKIQGWSAYFLELSPNLRHETRLTKIPEGEFE